MSQFIFLEMKTQSDTINPYMDTPDPAVYPKYCEYIRLKEEAQNELLGRRSELLKLKHQDGVQNLGEIQRLLHQNHEFLIQVGIFLDLTWEMPVISEYFPITE